VSRRGWVGLAVWLLVILVSGWRVGAGPAIETDLTSFMPRAQDRAERLLVEALREGPTARQVLIGIEGADAERRAHWSAQLARHLRDSGLFSTVSNGARGAELQGANLLLAHRYLLSPGVDARRFEPDALAEALRGSLRRLASPMAPVEERLLPADPTGEFSLLLARWRPRGEPHTHAGVWFSDDLSRALLLAQVRGAGSDLDVQERAVGAIRTGFRQIADADGGRLLLAGPAVYATASRDTIRSEVRLLSLAAGASVLIILWTAYRNIRAVALAALPLATGVLIAAAVVSALFGSLHGLTLAFGTTLIGVAVDYPVHLLSHLGRGRSPRHAVATIWPTIRLGVLTTVLGYTAMLAADYQGLAQLGAFAMVGLLAAAATTRWLLPELLPASVQGAAPSTGRVLRPLLVLQGRLALLPALVLGAVVLALLARTPIVWQDDLAAASPLPEDLRRVDTLLRGDFGAPELSQGILIAAPDAQTALRRSERASVSLERLVSVGALDGFESASNYLPSAETQLGRRSVLPDRAELAARMERVTADLPFRPSTFEPFLDAVAAARRQAPLMPEDVRDTALGTRLDSLLLRRGDRWVSLIPLYGVRDAGAIEAAVAGPRQEDTHYINQRRALRQMMTRLRTEALERGAWSGLAIVAVLAIALRSPRRLGRTVLPLALGLLVTFGLLVAAGHAISLFHLIALLVVLGISVDYSLFFNRNEPEDADRLRTVRSVVVCATSTAAVFGILALSAIPVLHAIGITVLIGVIAGFLFSLAMGSPPSPAGPRRR